MKNGSAIGYALMVLKDLKWSDEALRAFESDMLDKMDMYTEEEAEEVYKNN